MVALASAADRPVKHCVGTLVAPSVVVTASHCVMNREPADLTVIAGRTDLRTRDGVEVPAADLWEVPGAFDGNPILGGLSGPVAAAPDLGTVLLAEPLAQPTLPLDTTGGVTPARPVVFHGWRVDQADRQRCTGRRRRPAGGGERLGPDPGPATPNHHARVATHAAELPRLIDRAGVTGRFTG